MSWHARAVTAALSTASLVEAQRTLLSPTLAIPAAQGLHDRGAQEVFKQRENCIGAPVDFLRPIVLTKPRHRPQALCRAASYTAPTCGPQANTATISAESQDLYKLVAGISGSTWSAAMQHAMHAVLRPLEGSEVLLWAFDSTWQRCPQLTQPSQ